MLFASCCCCCPAQDVVGQKSAKINAVPVTAGFALAPYPGGKPPGESDEEGEGEEVFTALLAQEQFAQPLGMIVEGFAPEAIFIAQVDEDDSTVVGRHNARAPARRRLRPGDYIISVSGERGPGAVDRLSSFARAELVVSRSRLRPVTVRKRGLPLGLILKYDTFGTSLYIKAVEESGAARACDADIELGDRIVCVNGRTGTPPTLLEGLKAGDVVELQISRP